MTEPQVPEKKSHTTTLRETSFRLASRWPENLIEIIVVIIGITISFVLNSKKEESERVSLEQVYLKNLHSDILTK